MDVLNIEDIAALFNISTVDFHTISADQEFPEAQKGLKECVSPKGKIKLMPCKVFDKQAVYAYAEQRLKFNRILANRFIRGEFTRDKK